MISSLPILSPESQRGIGLVCERIVSEAHVLRDADFDRLRKLVPRDPESIYLDGDAIEDQGAFEEIAGRLEVPLVRTPRQLGAYVLNGLAFNHVGVEPQEGETSLGGNIRQSLAQPFAQRFAPVLRIATSHNLILTHRTLLLVPGINVNRDGVFQYSWGELVLGNLDYYGQSVPETHGLSSIYLRAIVGNTDIHLELSTGGTVVSQKNLDPSQLPEVAKFIEELPQIVAGITVDRIKAFQDNPVQNAS